MGSKWVIKCWRKLLTITNFAQEFLTNRWCRGGTIHFIKEARTMEIKHSDRTSEAVSGQLRIVTMADLIITQDPTRELRVGYSIVMQHLKETGKVWKSSINGQLVSLLKIKRNCRILLVSSITMNYFFIRLGHEIMIV